MFHDIRSFTPDKNITNYNYNNTNYNYFFDYDISSLKSLGIKVVPPLKNYISAQERLKHVNLEIDTYKSEISKIVKNIRDFNKNYNINILIKELSNIENIIIKKYKIYLNKDCDKIFKAIEDLKKNYIPLLIKLNQKSNNFLNSYNNFLLIKQRINDYLYKLENDQSCKLNFIISLLNKKLKKFKLENNILTDKGYKLKKLRLLKEINNMHIDN